MKKCKTILVNHLKQYRKEYKLLSITFILGIIIGVLYIQKKNTNDFSNINSYIQTLIENIKNSNGINRALLLVECLKNNCIFILIIWFLGCTIIGSFLVYLACLYKGFSIGYTITAIVLSLGVKNGIIFSLVTMLLQNIVLICAIFIVANSGIQLYVNIRKNCVNLKIELLKHTIIMLISLILSVVASFIEVYISTNFLIFLKDFF